RALQKIRLCVWDTAGQERFRQLAPSYIRDAHVILIVFDLTAPNIVEQITRWMLFVEAEREEGAQIIFVGNKCDLKQRKLDPSVAMRMMAEYKAPYVETSAKTGFNIKEVSQCQVDLLGDLWAAARPATGSAKKRGAVPVHERTSLSATKLLPTVVKMYITSQ
ncbi:Ras family protein, partial [Ancylostoma caninum]